VWNVPLGVSLLRKQTSINRSKRKPADALPGDRQKCLEVGMDEYLTKPVEFRKFSELVERLGRSL
jgi:response regulator RpfG family c-di-GMP phosphodiesterase